MFPVRQAFRRILPLRGRKFPTSQLLMNTPIKQESCITVSLWHQNKRTFLITKETVWHRPRGGGIGQLLWDRGSCDGKTGRATGGLLWDVCCGGGRDVFLSGSSLCYHYHLETLCRKLSVKLGKTFFFSFFLFREAHSPSPIISST